MKKIKLLFLFFLPTILMAQNVAINNDGSAPDNNAMLDIKSSTKGFLIPRLTTLARTSIAGPVIGLTVFDSETVSYWMYRGDLNGGWAELQHNYQNHWATAGLNVYNTNNGNIGIGTNNPTQKLSINATDPSIDFMNAGASKGYLQANGNNMRVGTYANNTTGNIVFNTKAVDRMWIDENGKVGIGTASPSGALTVDGTNPFIEMRTGGVYKGYLWASGNDLKVGTSVTNATGNLIFQTKVVNRMVIDENGQVGIGTNSPTSILSINASDPILQLKNSGIDKGFVQLVNDDIKIGTNQSNTTGKFIVRTKGVDRLSIDEDGFGTFGSSTSDGLLQINGPNFPGLLFQHNNQTQGYITAAPGELDIFRSNPGKIRIRANGDGMHFKANGQISVGGGGQTATGYVFNIEGRAIAEEFRVLSVGSWPDYVFADDYPLRPLSDVKKFIAENKHLPNIPSAKEVEKEGIQLGEMSKKLMEKVEELTMYMIQLNEQNVQLQKQIDELKKGIQQ